MENIYDLKGIEEDKTEELDILLMKIKLYHFALFFLSRFQYYCLSYYKNIFYYLYSLLFYFFFLLIFFLKFFLFLFYCFFSNYNFSNSSLLITFY